MKKMLLYACATLVLGACENLPVNTPDNTVSIDPKSVEMVEGESVQLTASVSGEGSVVWSSSKESVATVSQDGLVTGLTAGRAFIKATVGEQSASCLVVVYFKAPEAVNLGLSVNWASCNVGASSPEEFGDFYAWGEVEPKEIYSWDNYKWKGPEEWGSITKYSSEYGLVVLEPGDDVAHVSYGGSWRMPTKEEIEELIDGCTSDVVEQKGVMGCLFTSKQNENSIFIPFAGYKAVQNTIGPVHGDVGKSGHLWSSTFNSVSQAYDLTNGSLSITTASVGYNVRGVTP